jgi:type IV secretory pathway VirB4 component
LDLIHHRPELAKLFKSVSSLHETVSKFVTGLDKKDVSLNPERVNYIIIFWIQEPAYMLLTGLE